jgi:hypothetical protein
VFDFFSDDLGYAHVACKFLLLLCLFRPRAILRVAEDSVLAVCVVLIQHHQRAVYDSLQTCDINENKAKIVDVLEKNGAVKAKWPSSAGEWSGVEGNRGLQGGQTLGMSVSKEGGSR